MTQTASSCPVVNESNVIDAGSRQPLSRPPAIALTAVAAAVALTACGGGNAPVISAPNEEVSDEWIDDGSPPTQAQAAAFLAQAGFGGTLKDVNEVVELGFEGWLDKHIAMPSDQGHVAWLLTNKINEAYFTFYQQTMWRKFVISPDQLRQRMVYAWSQIFVVSTRGLEGLRLQYELGYYLDTLETHALGNFRDLLEAVTLNPAMGSFLNMRGSRKAQGVIQPDENYAREIMQLFTIGLDLLNPDGTKIRDNEGKPIPAYSEDDIKGLAAVFTGWNWTTETDPTGQLTQLGYRVIVPMAHFANLHSTTEKRFLGITIPEGTSGPESLRIALDTLFNHPNTGPFIAIRLIQRLVTSNPTPAYVRRVARVFDDNGEGVRGDLAAVVKAIFLGREARGQSAQPPEHRGKLREPVLRYLQWARTFGAKARGNWNVGNIGPQLGQMPLSAPSVFNFYTYDFTPPNTGISAAGLLAPEFNLVDEPNVVNYLNFMTLVANNETELAQDKSLYDTLARDPEALVLRLDLLLTGSRLSESTRQMITQAVGTIPIASSPPASVAATLMKRVSAAALLIMACPEYLVQKT
ncbi:MAG: hypothetical protein RL297_365 [Pseudomonadota bacterium]